MSRSRSKPPPLPRSTQRVTRAQTRAKAYILQQARGNDSPVPGEPTEEQQLSEPVQLPNPKDSLREDELAPQPKRKRVNPSPEQVSRQRPKRQRRRLTKENLKTLRREAAVVELPAALDEWSLILQGSPKSPHEPRPPSEPKHPPNNIVAMEANKQSTEPKKTGRTTARTVCGGLQDDPRRYATRMRNEHGVQSYGFFPVRGSRSQKEKGLASAHFPSNFDDIQTTLLKAREDLPSHFQFLRFCQRSSRSPDEAQMNEVFGHFLDLDQWQEARHYYGRETLLVPHQDLPQPQSKILPDLVIGIDPESLGIHLWVQKHLCSHVQSQTAVCVNGLVEYKSLEGSLSTARIQNQAAASLLCRAWLADEEQFNVIAAIAAVEAAEAAKSAASSKSSASTARSDAELVRLVEDARVKAHLLAEQAVLGKAFVGSICFDGNSIEASVHWLDRSLSSQERQYDVFSMRVATGHPFAATLAGYRSSHHEFANFLDWMSSTRDLRWTQITECPTKEPAAMTFEEREGCLPTKSDGEEEDEDDEEEDDDDDRGDEADKGDCSDDASENENENENQDKRDGPGAQAGSAGQATTSNRQRTEELGAERRLDIPGAVLNTIWAAIKTLKRKRQ